ncbi:class I SAM-dependent methyltransferase [Legionella taurinensis]|uniref:class I SAM-dependent methyltransferase n=1 Tax=Legionella taurinensis TaxID=70611 RepID=UPI00299D8CAB|nr:class I SAM-dependent methyltransferase [Legionella taurinensis]MDX1837288.1 class I SAM-dependent methyltransferase [Legionella taurinensis]
MPNFKTKTSISSHNESAWDQQALLQSDWSKPVSSETIEEAKKGNWQIHITKKALPESWLPKNIQGKDILCLASAGGQQAPVLAAAGAKVTVFDISEKQLDHDRFVAERHQLKMTTIHGDMSDLSTFDDHSFDYIVHPISNLYVSNLDPVWQGCYRILRRGGYLLSSFYNPILFVFEKNKALEQQGLLRPINALPYSDIEHLTQEAIDAKISSNEAVVFGHTLTSQIEGQLSAGFLLEHFYEDEHPSPRFLIEKFMKTMIATKAIKRL